MDGVLEGDKAIAACLSLCWGHEVSVARVVRYREAATDDPLPHWRIRGSRSVFAHEGTLVEWAARQFSFRRRARRFGRAA